jgi:hypothetical protein
MTSRYSGSACASTSCARDSATWAIDDAGVTADLLNLARAGDGDAFRQLIEPFERCRGPQCTLTISGMSGSPVCSGQRDWPRHVAGGRADRLNWTARYNSGIVA